MLFDLLELHFKHPQNLNISESSWSKPTEKITSRYPARKYNSFLTEGIFWPSIIPNPGRDLPAPRDVQDMTYFEFSGLAWAYFFSGVPAQSSR